MTVKYHQISLKDTFSDCRDMFIDDTPSFFQLLEGHFDISEFIPSVFYNAFYQHLGRRREYPHKRELKRKLHKKPVKSREKIKFHILFS